MDLMTTLSKIPLFATLEQAELTELTNLLGIQEFMPRQTMVEEGKPPPALYIILEGSISVMKRDSEGTRDHICDLPAGECIGEVEIIDGSPCTASCICREQVKAAFIQKENLEFYFHSHPEAAIKVLRQMVTILATRIRESNISYSNLMTIAETM